LDRPALSAARDELLAAVDEVRAPMAVVLDLDGLTVLSAAASQVLSEVAELGRSHTVPVSVVVGADRPVRQAVEQAAVVPVFDTVVSALETVAQDRPDGAGGARREQFAVLTQSLLQATTVAQVLDRVVRAAQVMLPTADLASITLREPGGVLCTPVRSDALADRLDALQYQFQEGPCYDAALPSGPGTSACADLAGPVVPWPKFAPQAAELGMAAVVATALLTETDPTQATGALNVYSRTAHGLENLDGDVMLLLATHASLAVANTRSTDYAHLRETQLRRALDSRDVIGQAKGIIMARRGVGPDDAFDILRRASQDLNVKLVELAETLTTRHHELDT
jgi:anti-anti-sigma regulatory factor